MNKQKSFLATLTVMLCLLAASEAGAQWTLQRIAESGTLTDCVMLDTLKAFAVGRNREILRTTDGGATWINQTAPLSSVEPWNGLSFFDSLHGAAVGDDGVVMVTTDGGAMWKWRLTSRARTLYAALQVGPGNIYVGADSGWIYHSLDTGATWNAEKVSQWPIRALFCWRGAYLFEFGLPVFALTPQTILAKTEFPSSPWHEAMLQPFMGLGSEAFDGEFAFGGGPGFVVGVQGDLRAAPAIVRANIADTLWKNIGGSIPEDGTLFGVSVPSAHTIYVCGSHGMLYKSSDTGATWHAQSAKTTVNLNALSFTDERHGLAVGDSGVILWTRKGGDFPVEVQEARGVPLEEFRLEQNRPNPFNPSTKIFYSLDRRMKIVLEIVDLLGRRIALLEDGEHTPGRYSVEWSGRTSSGHEASSGVYFCRLRSVSGRQAVTRLLLMR